MMIHIASIQFLMKNNTKSLSSIQIDNTRVQIHTYVKSSSCIKKKVATEWLKFIIPETSVIKTVGFRREITLFNGT